MAKKLVAVTNVNHDGEFTEAGGELDPDKFTREQLQALYIEGAVRVEETPDEVAQPDTEGPAPETPEPTE